MGAGSPKLKGQEGMELPVRPRASSRLIGNPQQPGGTTNPPLHPIRDVEFWPPANDGLRIQDDGSLDPDNDWGALAEAQGQSNQESRKPTQEGPPTHCGCLIQ